MPIIDGKHYTHTEIAHCFLYWQDYLDKQEVEDAINIGLDGVDPQKDAWVEANKMTLFNRACAMLDDWRDDREYTLCDLGKSMTEFTERFIREEWNKHKGEIKNSGGE